MSKLVAIRLPDELHAKIEAEGKVSTVIIAKLTAAYATPTPKPSFPALHAPTKPPTLPVRPSTYQRIAHSPTCTCYTCRPPKPA